MSRITASLLAALAAFAPLCASASDAAVKAGTESPTSSEAGPPSQYDQALAESLGADERGMRSYVLVVLMTGPTRMPDGEERKQMFAGHMANIGRLAAEEKLVFAGPLDGVDGWRGIFVFDTPDIEVAKTYVSTDPVIISGEMVAEYHQLYGSAALKMVNGVHGKLSKPPSQP